MILSPVRSLWAPVAALLAVLLLVCAVLAWSFHREAERTALELRAEAAAHRITVARVRIASAEAGRRDLQNLRRVEAQQQDISKGIVDAYETKLADARARAERLRLDAARAGRGGGGGAAMPAAGAPAGRADAAPGQDGLPAADALIATEQALQLGALIEWVAAQAAVDVNGADQAGEDRQ
jgi:hypothetical protein